MRKLLPLLAALTTTACLDVDLGDELNWPAGRGPLDAGRHGPDGGSSWNPDGAPWPDGAGFDAAADTGHENAAPPWLVGAGACAAGEASLGALCVSTSPWSVAVRLWASEAVIARLAATPAGESVEAVEAAVEHHLVLGDLAPEADHDIVVSLINRAGGRVDDGPHRVATPAVVAPVVITEVLLDPLGPEPRQEMVEILVVGEEPVSIDGWTLEDDAGADVLTAAEPLPPGGFALIVPSGWIPGDGGDPPPAPRTRVVTVDGSLGAGGLRNDGERVTLRDGAGLAVSAFPAPARAAGAGVSIVRLDPRGPDGDPANWAPHPAGSSSPGRP